MLSKSFYDLMAQAWTTKHKGYPFRRLRTIGFDTMGGGNTYVTLRKWGNSYVVGHSKYHQSYQVHVDPADMYYRIWFIAKPTKLHILNHNCDQSAHSLLNGMGLWSGQQFSHTNRVIRASTPLVGFLGLCPYTFYDKGVTVYNDGHTRPIGRSIEPEVFIPDKKDYADKRDALRYYWKLLGVFARHETLKPLMDSSWHDLTSDHIGWDFEVIKKLLAFHERGKHDLTPDDFYRLFKRDYNYAYPYPTLRTVYNNWAVAACKMGVSRIVDVDGARYTRLFNTEPNYDKLIGAY